MTRPIHAPGGAIGALVLGAVAAALLAAPAAIAQTLTAADVSQPEGWDDDLRMPEVEDINPDPHILEFDLEAKITELEIVPGVKTPVWAYNGMLPGPMIRAEVGDRLIVHFKNSLPDPTTIHWHGVRVPNAMDGAPGLTQDPIPPGGTFEYDFILQDAGTYWYHPHFNSPEQVAAGLYGAIVVEDPNDPEEFGDELVLMFSDIDLKDDGTLSAADRGGVFGDLFGREGDIVLVNGKIRPTLTVRKGKQQRWRVIDAAITRYFQISLRGHRWTRLGGDNGLMEHTEEDLPRLVVAAAERADVVFTPADDPGTTHTMYWLPVDRGLGTAGGRGRVPMMDIVTTNDAPVEPVAIPYHLRDIPPIDTSNAIEETLELTIDLDKPQHDMMGINGVAHDFMLTAHVGETHVWTVVNNTDFDHPFHLHGYFFQVLDPARTPEWKDVVNVPAHTTTRLAMRFDDRPGYWMVHCHILDHAEVGMMGHLHVMEAGGSATGDEVMAH